VKSLILFVLGMCSGPAAQKCQARCDTIAMCGDPWAVEACKDDCRASPSDPKVATCIVDAGCAQIHRRIAMDLDIVGLCRAEARR
jgi:hypothetical protein